MKIVITHIQFDIFTKRPTMVQITIFDQLGVEQLRTTLPIRMFSNTQLEVGSELVLTPKLKVISSVIPSF